MKSQVDFSTSLMSQTLTFTHRIIWILLTMPVSSATSERSFGAMQRVKSYLRSPMGDERLSNVFLLHVHRHLNVDVDTAIKDFISRKSRRLNFDLTSITLIPKDKVLSNLIINIYNPCLIFFSHHLRICSPLSSEVVILFVLLITLLFIIHINFVRGDMTEKHFS